MLVLTRELGQAFLLISGGRATKITVGRAGKNVRLHIDAPAEVLVVRDELVEEYKRRKKLGLPVDSKDAPPIGLDSTAKTAG